MSTYSLSDAPRLRRRARASRARRVRLRAGSGNPASAFSRASRGSRFGLSCLWWEDVGDWSRTHSLGIAAFIVAGDRLVRHRRRRSASAPPVQALRQRAPWLLVLGAVPDVVGGCDREIRLAAAAVLPAAAVDPRGLHRRSAEAARQRLCLGQAAARRLCDRRHGRLPDRRLDRLVAQRSAIGCIRCCASSGRCRRPPGCRSRSSSFRRAGAPATFLIALATGFPVTVLTWSGVASVSNAYYDVARTLGAKPSLPGAEGRHPGGDAARLRRPVHGPRLVVRRAGRGRDDRRQGRARLVPAMGAGLGGLRQHVCGADRDVAAVLRPDHAAVPASRDRLLVWQKGVVKW